MDALSLAAAEATGSQALDSVEQPFIGRWIKLVSTTNWQKGEIIYQWREALIAAGASSSEYSDESWSLRVGGVTSQHVGRLRRVFQRFGTSYEKYPNLFWSHFQAALDWDDAEMWLEGALQSDWSVAEMRRTRQETLGVTAAPDTDSTEASESEPADEDFVTPPDAEYGRNPTHVVDDELGLVPEGPDFGDESDEDESSEDADQAIHVAEPAVAVRPFESLRDFPPDIADAFEAFKLAILRHKSEGWAQITASDTLSALEALKQLVTAPSDLGA